MTLGSLFDGSGTAPLAASLCGIEPVWASEIEPYPIRVTTKRFPKMKHLGDITKVSGHTAPPVDIICGGSPCQDLSVAGKQAGLENGTRSHLFYEMTRIIKEMRDATNGEYPRYVIWENVPGAFASNNGKDFLSVLQGFAEIAEADIHVPEPERKADKLVWRYAGKMVGCRWSIAWRTIDAQYWGVPQRRRRIYLVVDFDSERAGEILFEQTGLPRHFESSIKAREGIADNAAEGTGRSDRAYLSFHLQQDPISSGTIAPCLSGQKQASVGVASFMGGQGAKARSIAYCDDGTSPTLRSSISGSNQAPDVVYTADCRNAVLNHEISGTLQAKPNGGFSYNCINPVIYPGVCITSKENKSNPKPGDAAPTLDTDSRKYLVYANSGFGKYQEGIATSKANGGDCGGGSENLCVNVFPDVTGPLMANSHPGSYSGQDAYNDMFPVFKENTNYIVRRLTPLECCRLQGFPDCWESDLETTDPSEEEIEFWTEVFETHRKVVSPDVKPKTRKQIIKWLKNPYSDSASYKMWGNGMALPCMLFVMKGVAKHERSNPPHK